MCRAVLATFLLRSALGLHHQFSDAPAPGWMENAETRPWGNDLSFDDKEGEALSDEKRKDQELKEKLQENMREAMNNNARKAEMEIDSSSGMEGFAEPLNESESEDIADSWLSLDGTDVTFSYSSFCHPEEGCRSQGHKHGSPSFQEMHRNVLATLRALRFCFKDVLLILDTNHVGHDKMGPETPGNVSAHMIHPQDLPTSEMNLIGSPSGSKVDSGLSTAALATAKAAAELLRDHCPLAAPEWKVKVVDYKSKDVQQRALEHYAIPEELKNGSFFDRMYMNTMALDENFQAKGKYVYYIDAQKRLYRSNFSRSTPNFIQYAVSLMKSDKRVYLASAMNTFNLEPQRNPYNKFAVIPGAVHGSTPVERVKGMLCGWSADQWLSQKRPLRGESFEADWGDLPEQETDRIATYQVNWKGWGTIVTHHNFLMDVDRFKTLMPLDSWDTAVEHMWSANMNMKFPDNAVQIYFNETVGLFAGPSEE